MPGDHAILSASGAERWMECTKSARLEETFPETSSTYADEGTFAHKLGELLIRRKLGRINQKAFEKKLAEYKEDEYYSTDLHGHVDNYAVYVIEQLNNIPGSHLLLEQRLDMTDYIDEGFGTGDAVLLQHKARKLRLIDLKFGKGVPVSAFQNKQLFLYGLGALKVFGWIYDFDEIEMTIFQPRLDSISSYTISTQELIQWAETVLKPIAAVAFRGEGEFKPGDHCRFCRAKQTCRALAERNLELARLQFEPGPLLTDEEIAEVLEKSALFKNWIGAVEEYALDEAVKNRKKWPGFKLVRGRSNRKYIDPKAIVEKLRESGFTDLEIFKDPEVRGITDMTGKIGAKDFDKYLHDLIIKPQGAPALVPITDERLEINSVAEVQKLFEE